MSQLAAQATQRAAKRSWHRIRKVHPYRMQQWVTMLFAIVVIIVGVRAGVKSIQRWRRCHPDPSDDSLGYSDPILPAPTAFTRSAELSRPVDACSEAANFPQVALLLLTKGDVAHDTLWREWFSLAEGKIPLAAAKAAFCEKSKVTSHIRGFLAAAAAGFSGGAAGDVLSKCFPSSENKLDFSDDDEDDVILKQHLFDVWVHTTIDFQGFPEGSVFHGRELPKNFRVRAQWGTHSIIDATRALLAAGLTNPRASKFVLISESDVPLYSPMALYSQIIAEPKSRVNACNETTTRRKDWNHNDGWRLRDDMLAEGLTPSVWRKGWQWIALNRDHAQLAVDDIKVDSAFRATCRRRWDPDWCDHRVCYSDEHYFPTLLAAAGKEDETDCYGELTDRDWSRVASTDPHPWEYQPSEVSQKLLRKLRYAERPGCAHAATISSTAKDQFVDLKTLAAREGGSNAKGITVAVAEIVCDWIDIPYKPLGPYCPLLARKFLNTTTDAVLAAVLPCSNGLNIINEASECDGSRAERQRAMLSGLNLTFPADEFDISAKRGFEVLALIVLGMCVLLIMACVLRNKRERSRQLPLTHSESFHTTLKHYGVIE